LDQQNGWFIKDELEIQRSELEEWHFFVFGANLLSIENKIYRDIEKRREKMLYKQLTMV
jgi:hypothetical protein